MGKLVRNVFVDGAWWGPAYGNADDVPDDVAEQITGASCWAGDSPAAQHPSGMSLIHDSVLRPLSGDRDTQAVVDVPAPPLDRGDQVTVPAVHDEVPSGSATDVLAWVNGAGPGEPPAVGWQDRASAALAAEETRGDRARKSVVEPLTVALANQVP